MLSVPPAFVLSQDQTLYYSCIYKPFRLKYLILFITLALLKISFFSLFLTFLVKGFSRVVFSLALFNFQDAVPLNSRQATYSLYHISFGLSSTFFNFFKKIFCKLAFRSPKSISFQKSLHFPASPSDSFIIISRLFLIVK